jgi:hypothetical protein
MCVFDIVMAIRFSVVALIVGFFLNSSFLDFALQYNISNDNRLILVDIFIGKE